MTYHTTKVERLNDLVTASHTIFSVINHDGKLVIISTTA